MVKNECNKMFKTVEGSGLKQQGMHKDNCYKTSQEKLRNSHKNSFRGAIRQIDIKPQTNLQNWVL